MSEKLFSSNLLGSGAANLIFAMVFFIGAWLKTRLNKSNCASNCYCFECESSLQELQSLHNKLERTQTTQNRMLQELITHINSDVSGSPRTLRKKIIGENMV